MERLLEMDELGHLALHQLADRDAGPRRDHLSDVFLGDLLVEHLAVPLEFLEPRVLGLKLLLELDEPAEPQLRRAIEVALALGTLELPARVR